VTKSHYIDKLKWYDKPIALILLPFLFLYALTGIAWEWILCGVGKHDLRPEDAKTWYCVRCRKEVK
jgi:hypothetical protein